jgi:NAD(P)-dependent dehydrogenase (short-subunit alcohol dehydrogenase family)
MSESTVDARTARRGAAVSGDRRVALITGANKGIGYHTAQLLGQQGLTVLVGARDEARGVEAAEKLAAEGLAARFVQLDVTDAGSVARAAGWIDETYGRLDVLVNNAGVLLDGGRGVTETTVDQLRETFETNVFGVAAVLTAMLPLLRRSAAGRVVNLSSKLGSLGENSTHHERLAPYQLLGYCSSKAAVNALTVLYANALRPDGIKVNSVEPGFVATDLNGHAGPGRPHDAARVVARFALLGPDGPTGAFHEDAGPVPW